MNPREVLERPFEPDQIKTRPGRNGETIVYLESATVVARLNSAFDGEWSFTIEKHEILEDEVVVLGRLTAGSITKSAFGTSSITRTRDGGKTVSLGSDLKAAASDSLKKCSTLLGVGLTLHAGGATPAAGADQRPPARPVNGNGYLSSAQLRAVHAIRRRLGWSDSQLADFASKTTGTSDVETMDKRSASALIQRLQEESTPVSATR